MRLGELVKIGFAKAQERTADDWQDIAAIKAKQAEDAEAKALETANRAARDADRALKRLVADARRRANPKPLQAKASSCDLRQSPKRSFKCKETNNSAYPANWH